MAKIAFQDDNGHLRTHPDDPHLTNLQLGMMAGTSPCIVGLPGGAYVLAFQANTGILWTYSDDGNWNNSGRAMAPGTDPSIAVLGADRYVIAFQDDNGNLRTHPEDLELTNRRAAMREGTSPSIAVLGADRYVIAFQDDNGNLRTHPEDDQLTHLQLGMTPGTSPSVTWANGGNNYVIAFQEYTGSLETYASFDFRFPWDGSVVLRGTSPSTTHVWLPPVLPGGDGFEDARWAWQNRDGLLRSNGFDLHLAGLQLGMMPGTSPSITRLNEGGDSRYQIAFQANTGVLWTYTGPNGDWDDSGRAMLAGTSPSIADAVLII
jgi:hypothetical protein